MSIKNSLLCLALCLGGASMGHAKNLSLACENSKTGAREALIFTTEGQLITPFGAIELAAGSELYKFIGNFPDFYDLGEIAGKAEDGTRLKVVVEYKGDTFYGGRHFAIGIESRSSKEQFEVCVETPLRRAFH